MGSISVMQPGFDRQVRSERLIRLRGGARSPRPRQQGPGDEPLMPTSAQVRASRAGDPRELSFRCRPAFQLTGKKREATQARNARVASSAALHPPQTGRNPPRASSAKARQECRACTLTGCQASAPLWGGAMLNLRPRPPSPAGPRPGRGRGRPPLSPAPLGAGR